MAAVFRKASIVPFALRAISSPRILSRPATNVFNAAIVKRESSFSSSHNFSTDAKKLTDQKFVQALKPKINHPKYVSLEEIMPVPPPNFPFTIEENPCSLKIYFKRELDGETIVVRVSELWKGKDDDSSDEDEEKPDADKDDGKEKPDADENDGEEKPDSGEEEADFMDPSDHVMLKITISKEIGKGVTIFEIEAMASERCMNIHHMSIYEKLDGDDDEHDYRLYPMKEKGNEDLESALIRFLEKRGIDQTIAGFGSKYMVYKYRRDRKLMLEKVNNFVEEEETTNSA